MKCIQDKIHSLKGVVERLIITKPFRVWLITLLFFIIFNSSFVIVNAQLQGQAYVDSLIKELPKANDDTNKVILIYQLSLGMRQIQQDKALEYAVESLNLSKKISWKIGIIKSYHAISNIFQAKDDFNKALEYYLKALDLSKEISYNRGISVNLHNIGGMYFRLNINKLALDYLFQAIEFNKKHEYIDLLSDNFRIISQIYKVQRNFDKAIEYSLEALNLNLKFDYKSQIATNYADLAGIYWDQKEYEKSLEHYFKSAELCMELDDKYRLALNYGNIGELYYVMANGSNSNSGQIQNTNKSNKAYLIKSKEYLLKTLSIYQKLNNVDELIWYYNSISNVYVKLNEFKFAHYNLEKSLKLKDSLISIQGQLKYKALESKLEFGEKQKKIENQKHQIEKQKSQQLIMLIGLSSLVIIVFSLAFLLLKIQKQKSTIENQKILVEKQKNIVEEKNEEIYASMTYASTIQHAILPWDNTLENAFSEIFIFYKPKDIVSGDFYWFQEVDGIKYLAVIDCTGHGIPGAMLTVIASTVLDDAVLGRKLLNTNEILTYMNEKVTEVLNQKLSENKIRDGMEVALIAIHQNKVQYSGAGRPLFYKNGSLNVVKTDKRGIAGSSSDEKYQFSSIEIERNSDLILYLSSDGFADQMNESSKKYSTKRFINLLETISEMPLSEQSMILENEFNAHRGNREQIDDITIFGVKL